MCLLSPVVCRELETSRVISSAPSTPAPRAGGTPEPREKRRRDDVAGFPTSTGGPEYGYGIACGIPGVIASEDAGRPRHVVRYLQQGRFGFPAAPLLVETPLHFVVVLKTDTWYILRSAFLGASWARQLSKFDATMLSILPLLSRSQRSRGGSFFSTSLMDRSVFLDLSLEALQALLSVLIGIIVAGME